MEHGITLQAAAPLFYKGDRHPNRLGFFLSLFGDQFGDQYRRYRWQLRMLIFTTGRIRRRVDRIALGGR
jgi:hypothetical protein